MADLVSRYGSPGLSAQEMARRSKKISKGATMSAPRPTLVERAYEGVDALMRPVYSAIGMDERGTYQNAQRLTKGIEDILGFNATEKSARRIVSGDGRAEDYLGAALAAVPLAAKPLAKLAAKGVRKAAPRIAEYLSEARGPAPSTVLEGEVLGPLSLGGPPPRAALPYYPKTGANGAIPIQERPQGPLSLPHKPDLDFLRHDNPRFAVKPPEPKPPLVPSDLVVKPQSTSAPSDFAVKPKFSRPTASMVVRGPDGRVLSFGAKQTRSAADNGNEIDMISALDDIISKGGPQADRAADLQDRLMEKESASWDRITPRNTNTPETPYDTALREAITAENDYINFAGWGDRPGREEPSRRQRNAFKAYMSEHDRLRDAQTAARAALDKLREKP